MGATEPTDKMLQRRMAGEEGRDLDRLARENPFKVTRETCITRSRRRGAVRQGRGQQV